MLELVRNAWIGWREYTTAGKLAALLLVSLIYLWHDGKWKKKRILYSYTVLTTLGCILPLTAAALMLYQTRFYDYVWIWSLVPMTAVIAWGATELLSRYWKGFKLAQWKSGLPVTTLLLATLVLCSGMGKLPFDRSDERDKRQQAREALMKVAEQKTGDLCLWAPREIMEYAREFDGSIQLLYGRDMWDASLGAYSYDIYSQDLQNLYLWIENTDETGVASVESGEWGKSDLHGTDSLVKAVEIGANCILLPSCLEPQIAEKLAETVGGSVSQLEDYYFITPFR